MKKIKTFPLLLLLVFALSIFTLAGCDDNDKPASEDTGTGTTNTTNDVAKDEAANNQATKDNKSTVTMKVTSPNEDEKVTGGSTTVTGTVEGTAKEVKCTILLDDETVIGESTALIADVSHEFTTKINYTVPEDKKDEKALDCKIKIICLDQSGTALEEITRHITIN